MTFIFSLLHIIWYALWKSNARVRQGAFLPPPPIYELSSQNTPYKLARVKESTFPWWFCVFGGLEGYAGWVTSGLHWFPLCLCWSGNVVDSRCQGDKLGPMKLAFGGGGLAN